MGIGGKTCRTAATRALRTGSRNPAALHTPAPKSPAPNTKSLATCVLSPRGGTAERRHCTTPRALSGYGRTRFFPKTQTGPEAPPNPLQTTPTGAMPRDTHVGVAEGRVDALHSCHCQRQPLQVPQLAAQVIVGADDADHGLLAGPRILQTHGEHLCSCLSQFCSTGAHPASLAASIEVKELGLLSESST